MPRYEYLCPKCGAEIEVVRPMADYQKSWKCVCGIKMHRNIQAEMPCVGAGKRSYHKLIVSNSMAMNPNQIAEHRQKFPDIEVTKEGQPVFDNFADHEKYMKECNIEKRPQKIRKRGRRIA